MKLKLLILLIFIFFSLKVEAQTNLTNEIQFNTNFKSSIEIDSAEIKRMNSNMGKSNYPIPEGAIIVEFPTIEAKIKGGDEALQQLISTNFMVPSKKLKNTLKKCDTLFIQFEFIIDEKGKIENLKLVKNSFPELDQDLERIIYLVEWIRAEHRGKFVDSQCKLAINFTRIK